MPTWRLLCYYFSICSQLTLFLPSRPDAFDWSVKIICFGNYCNFFVHSVAALLRQMFTSTSAEATLSTLWPGEAKVQWYHTDECGTGRRGRPASRDSTICSLTCCTLTSSDRYLSLSLPNTDCPLFYLSIQASPLNLKSVFANFF